jgi:plasmid stabilization system protein ParE
MNATIVISPRAAQQIDAVDSEIAANSPQRADEFLRVLNARIEQLSLFPESGLVYRDNIRRLLLLHFPFSLFYTFDTNRRIVAIIALFPDRSDPRTWR